MRSSCWIADWTPVLYSADKEFLKKSKDPESQVLQDLKQPETQQQRSSVFAVFKKVPLWL
jgi:hypothetical protein